MARPAVLDDPDWSGWAATDVSIATRLGVGRHMVREARRRVGVLPLPRGRRRGSSTRPRASIVLSRPAADLIAERIMEQASPVHGPAGSSREMLASRIRAVHDAYQRGTTADLRAALIELAAGCGLMHDHLSQLDAA